MAISDTQKVDYLFKKLGYGVTKTDTLAFKRAFNESISSPLLLRGDKVWQEADVIPAVKPSSSSSQVTIYDDSGNGLATIECTEDITASDNRTWKTGLTDWVPTEFGATYLVKVYISTTADATPQSNGTQILSAGSGNDDEWFFDYQSGVVHFIGENLPTDIASGVTGKSIFVVGARYTGNFGVGAGAGGGAVGDLSISGTTISTNSGTNNDIILDPDGTGAVLISGAEIENLADPTDAQDAATKNYVDTQLTSGLAGLSADKIFDGNTEAAADDTIGAEKISFTINGTQVGEVVGTGLSIDQINPYTSATGRITFNTVSAFTIPAGTTAQRPATGVTGDLRYNTTDGGLEFWNGSTWTKPGASATSSETITPDGTSATYALNEIATVDSIIVTLNGVVQHTNAYTVATNSNVSSITFSQVPQATDEVNVRYLTLDIVFENKYRSNISADPTSSTAGEAGDYWINNKGQFFIYEATGWHVVSTDPITTVSVASASPPTSIFTFALADYRSAEFLVQSVNGTDYQINRLLLIHDDTTASINNTLLTADGTSEFVTLSATITGSNVLLQATTTSGTSTITVRSTLIPA